MDKLSVCRKCKQPPGLLESDGVWTVYCNCFDESFHYYAEDIRFVVGIWNIKFGDTPEMRPTCFCTSLELFRYGCRCPHAWWKQGSKNNA